MKHLKHVLIWTGISLGIGAIGHLAFGIDFIGATLIAGCALVLNGIVASQEDRGKFND